MILQTPCSLGQNTPLLKTPSYYRHPANTDTHYYGNPGITDTLLLRIPGYYGHLLLPSTLLLWTLPTPRYYVHPTILRTSRCWKHTVSTYHRYYKPLDIKDTLHATTDRSKRSEVTTKVNEARIPK